MGQNRKIQGNKTMIVYISLLFIILILLPFLPAFYELVKKEDAEKLFIDMDYSRDPRYFGKSFREIIKNSLKTNKTAWFRESKMSKAEIIGVSAEKTNIIPNELNYVLFNKGKLVIKNSVKCNKEIYSIGNVDAGEGCSILALASDGDIILRPNLKLIRWLDAGGNISIMENCDLGIVVSTDRQIDIKNQCSFKRLFGNPVRTAQTIRNADRQEPDVEKKSITVNGDLIIRKGIRLWGNLKINGNFVVDTEEKVEIFGSVFVEGQVNMSGNSFVAGNIYSQQSIYLKGVEVGSYDSVRSVIGKKEIQLYENVIVHGYIMTEGKGTTL